MHCINLSLDWWKSYQIKAHTKTQVNRLTHLSHSGSVHGQDDSKMSVQNESFCLCSDTLWLKWVKWFTRGFQCIFSVVHRESYHHVSILSLILIAGLVSVWGLFNNIARSVKYWIALVLNTVYALMVWFLPVPGVCLYQSMWTGTELGKQSTLSIPMGLSHQSR